jgi:DNA-binding MarR family transcriptional regulator
VEAKRARIAATEPVIQRIIAALAAAPAIPAGLAGELGVAPETVSRKLAELRKEGLVAVQDVSGDARMRQYRLTPEGEVRLSQQRAFGSPGPPPADPSQDERNSFLESATARAVEMRRKTNQLDAAADRLRVVVQHAAKTSAAEIAVEATAELITTLRQRRQGSEVTELLGFLAQIAMGRTPHAPATLALPANAHREYALGRLAELELDARDHAIRHLISAGEAYGQLADEPPYGSSESWKARRAWSIVSVAGNLRALSRFEEALDWTNNALRLFDEADDAYGRSRCFFMAGFCLRLLGDFDQAWLRLHEAHALAEEHSYERFLADSLMQMGEVCRCRGELSEARTILHESVERARRMQLTAVEAFARSALGAVAYEEASLGEAADALRVADALFRACDHREGLALNQRRQAVVERTAAAAARADHLEPAKDFVNQALQAYRALRSPAGIAACEIETGRVRLIGREHPSDAVGSLVRRLEDTRQRNFLELDPWFPNSLCAFASEVEDEDLSNQASQLFTAAERRRAERTGTVSDLCEDRPSNDMAGEARRDPGWTDMPLAA